MRASVQDQGDELRFLVEEADAATAALLRAQFFVEVGDGFEKRFRRADLLFAHDVRAIETRWARHLREAPLRAVTPSVVDQALAWVADRHAEAVVAPAIVEPFQRVRDWVVKGFGVVDRGGLRVDYAFEPEAWVDGHGVVDFGPTAARHLEAISWRGRTLRVPPLATHLRSNEARGRHERVALIRAAMDRAADAAGR